MQTLLTRMAINAWRLPDMNTLRESADTVEQTMAIENHEWLVSIMTRPGPPVVPG